MKNKTSNIKSVLKSAIPDIFLAEFKPVVNGLRTFSARKRFENAPKTPAWLGRDMLERLQKQYPFHLEYSWDLEHRRQRGEERANELIRMISTRAEDIKNFLEIGCYDGMASCALSRMGKATTGIDITTKGFSEEVVKAGTALLQMDACDMRFKDGQFDFVFSYNSFEHFPRPDKALLEAARVVREGGYIYLFFGPLYMSPLGLHAYKTITVPYCQFLFPGEMLKEFAAAGNLRHIEFEQLNYWSLEDYRRLWKRFSGRLRKVKYGEGADLSHLNLIEKYPSCFRNKTKCFDNLIISTIEVLFKKRRTE
ncbi:MAG: class I SAM-dependent methyltransferase [Planctomycetes bacterium]|nr:class I SAM-dependent methyltransferase [Planctomycetota bacterium]